MAANASNLIDLHIWRSKNNPDFPPEIQRSLDEMYMAVQNIIVRQLPTVTAEQQNTITRDVMVSVYSEVQAIVDKQTKEGKTVAEIDKYIVNTYWPPKKEKLTLAVSTHLKPDAWTRIKLWIKGHKMELGIGALGLILISLVIVYYMKAKKD